MTMPKTTVHKDHFFGLAEYKIGPSGKIFAMQPVPVSKCMSKSPHTHLWLSILSLYATHQLASLFFSKRIHSKKIRRPSLRDREFQFNTPRSILRANSTEYPDTQFI